MSQHNSVTTQHNTTQECHNTTVSQHKCHNTTQQCHNTTQQCHNTTQQCHNTTVSQHNSVTTRVTTQNLWFFQEKCLKVLKCYNFLWVQRRNNCSPAAKFANCVMTLYLLKVHLQTFLSIPITKKCQKFWVVTLLSQMSDTFGWARCDQCRHLTHERLYNSSN